MLYMVDQFDSQLDTEKTCTVNIHAFNQHYYLHLCHTQGAGTTCCTSFDQPRKSAFASNSIMCTQLFLKAFCIWSTIPKVIKYPHIDSETHVQRDALRHAHTVKTHLTEYCKTSFAYFDFITMYLTCNMFGFV